jgi:hypothetical protein
VELIALGALQEATFPGLVPLSITIVDDTYAGDADRWHRASG